MKNRKLMRIMAGVELPVLANYFGEAGIPEKINVAKLKCEACETEVVANKTMLPICPCCAGSMKAIGKTEKTLLASDLAKMHNLGTCESCDSHYVSNLQTLASLQDQKFNCLICSSEVEVVSDESDENDDSKTNDTPPPADKDATTPSAEDGKDNDDKAPSDLTDGDKELQDVLMKMGVGKDDSPTEDDNKDKPADTPPADNKPSDDKPAEETTSGDPDDEEDEDENEDEDEEATASAAVFRSSLKAAKKFSVVPTENFDKWFLFADESPLAVAQFNNAEDSVKKVFRSKDYVVAFNSALASDGGINEQLVKDFGFEPINVDVKLDDISRQIIKDKVEEKTKTLNERLASLSSLYDQCVGIAAVGIAKGIYTKGDAPRTALIAKLTANNVREPESLVDEYLAKELPNLMRSVLTQANELMKKSPDALDEAAEMVASATPRAVSTKSTKSNVVPLAVLSSDTVLENDPKNADKRNFHKTTAGVDRLPTGLLSGLNHRV